MAFNVVTAWDMEAHGNDPRHLRTAMLWLRAVNTEARRVQKVGGYGARRFSIYDGEDDPRAQKLKSGKD